VAFENSKELLKTPLLSSSPMKRKSGGGEVCIVLCIKLKEVVSVLREQCKGSIDAANGLVVLWLALFSMMMR